MRVLKKKKNGNANFSIWWGYTIFAGLMAYAVDVIMQLIPALYGGKVTLTLGNVWLVGIAMLSAGLACWHCNVRKGSDHFWKTGLETWCVFTILVILMIPGIGLLGNLGILGDTITGPAHGDITIPRILGVTVLMFIFSSIFSVPASLIGTIFFEIIMYVIRKYPKLSFQGEK